MKQNIGLDVKPPPAACADAKCPWHGALPVRGRVFEGIVHSSKPRNTAIVEWAYNRYLPKYERYAKKTSRLNAHNPPCIRAKEGDKVVIAECRPLSKTKGFVVVSVEQEKAKIFFARDAEKKSEKEMKKAKLGEKAGQPKEGKEKSIASLFSGG